ncbi:hypothetical protein PBY51_007442 [Eleginops maclovinus]|uniref:Uncharacterized protein n=1 Tax=Eleginops maclovinus TaxID=56733 RepID=A0AAN7X590_ELEMC|nr:hypothetical protein PBY51_007442 [Eleginops maclovinus]
MAEATPLSSADPFQKLQQPTSMPPPNPHHHHHHTMPPPACLYPSSPASSVEESDHVTSLKPADGTALAG